MSSRTRAARRHPNRHADGVVIAYCMSDKGPDPAFHNCLISLLLHERKGSRDLDVFGMISGPRIASARNQLAAAFLAHPKRPPWMLMLDTDMTFPPDLLEQLLKIADPTDTPILGGLCFAGGRNGKIEPTLKRAVVNDDGEFAGFETIWDFPGDQLVKVDATGAACLLVHRSVLERMAAEIGSFFAEATTVGLGAEIGEDVVFCIRANGLDYPVKVHTGIVIGHMKPQVIDLQSYVEFRRGITAEGEDEYLARQVDRAFPNQRVESR